mmetsp:Transcript_30159/g.64024  ORF Transcript_30159/g.64024 Transcript_30159/m.64024 type:complete len:111 (+) Transcript_30159:719-1051(+)
MIWNALLSGKRFEDVLVARLALARELNSTRPPELPSLVRDGGSLDWAEECNQRLELPTDEELRCPTPKSSSFPTSSTSSSRLFFLLRNTMRTNAATRKELAQIVPIMMDI